MTDQPWDHSEHDIAADLRAAGRITETLTYQPTEYVCHYGHRPVLCVGDAAFIEHTKQAHPHQARALGWA